MVYCTVCMNNTRKNKNVSYFNYPKDYNRRHDWLKAVGREDLLLKLVDYKTRQQYRICEDHFERNCIKFSKNRSVKYLYDDALPTLKLASNEGARSSSMQEDASPMVNDQGESTSGTNESQVEDHASASKSTRLIPLRRSAEDIIVSVYNYLQAEYEQLKSSLGASCDLSPLANILQRTAAATGVSEQAVSYILEEKERADDDELVMNASDAKRAKLTHDYKDGNVSPITDGESSCEPDEEHEDITEQDNEQTCDESEEPVETLKVEIKEEEDEGTLDPLQLDMRETQSAVQYILRTSAAPTPHTNTYSVHVSKPPAVLVYPQSSSGVLRVISIEPMTSHTTVKTEPDDDPPDSDTTASDVTLEPPS